MMNLHSVKRGQNLHRDMGVPSMPGARPDFRRVGVLAHHCPPSKQDGGRVRPPYLVGRAADDIGAQYRYATFLNLDRACAHGHRISTPLARAGRPCHERDSETHYHPSRRAFTLLELMISMALVAMLMISLVAALHVGFQSREVTVNAAQTNRSAELVMEVIRNDIESALPPARGKFEKSFEGVTNPMGDGFDDLDFFSTAPTALHLSGGVSTGDGDVKEIELTAYQPANSTDHVLVRRTWNNLLDPNYQQQYTQRNLQNVDEEVLCRHVVALTFQYFDPSQQSWMPTWDSTASQPANILPTAVQVTLQLQSPEKNSDGSQKLVTYTRVFQLPCIGASNDAASTTGTGTSSTGGTP